MVVGAAKLTKLAKQKLDLDEYRGLTMASGGSILVYIAEGMEQWEATDTIIHESVHVFAAIAKHMGEETIGEEFQAYTTAHIATTLLKEYNALYAQGEREVCSKLQNGKREVQLEAGTNQSTLGTDGDTPTI